MERGIISTGLIDEFDMLFVFNSGLILQKDIRDRLLSTDKILVMELGTDHVPFFEAPSLAALHSLSQLFKESPDQPDHSVLFLNAIGKSFLNWVIFFLTLN